MKKMNRIFSILLVAVMLLAAFPVGVFATESTDLITVASTKTSALAPGVTEQEVIAYDADGKRIVYYVVTAQTATTDTVEVKANYQNNDNSGTWGKATVIEQANAATEKRGYNVVATTNAAYYNVSTGQPTGAFVMEGVNINGNSTGNSYPFFAIMKDGTAMIGEKGTFSQYSDQIQEAVGGWNMLVWDGKSVATNNTSKYPRSTVGITAEGDVILMVADGNMGSYSIGLTYAEQAQIMLNLGCVAAVELDGGGSATYAAKLEGTDEVVLRSTPCDGTIRSVSNSIMVISTAVPDGTFDHANLSVDYSYYVPNSVVKINAIGADASGAKADIPENITWTLSDDSFGTIEDGVFTSNGKTGTVTAQMNYDNEIVGSVDIVLAHPDEISFAADAKTVPYGKNSDFTVTAMYNGVEMYATADAFTFTATVGSMNGFVYTAPTDETIKTATVTAEYKYATMDAIEVAVTFGKGSVVLEDFESGDASDWGTYYDMVAAAEAGIYTGGYTNVYSSSAASNYVDSGCKENVFLASAEDGYPVRSGKYSLAYTLDYTQSTSHANWQYAYLYYLGDLMTYRDVENGINGTRIGMWMYIPEEAVGMCARLSYTYKTSSGTLGVAYLYFTYQYVSKGFAKLTSEKIPEAGWAYVYCDLDDISETYVTSAYYKDENGNLTRDASTNYAPAFIQFIVSSSAIGAEKCTFYIDDITLDYSDVVDDRDAPVISNPKALDDLYSYDMGTTLDFNTVSFTADVAEDTSHGTNYTGLNTETAQIYVDGQKVTTTYSSGKIAATGVVLANGVHDISFEIADNQGNYTKVTKQITINANSDYAKVWVEGDAIGVNNNKHLYTGGQYNLLLKTDNVDAISTVTTQIWLNSASKWALEHMSVLYGFEVSYKLDDLSCIATVTVKRTGDVDATGEQTLVTIPVYAWSWDESNDVTATYQWKTNGCAPQVTVSYDVKYGAVTYTDDYAVKTVNYVAGFGGARVDVETELNSSIANLKNSIGEWHYHTEGEKCSEESECTVDGYTDRVCCTVCGSVIDWGTVEKAEGHKYGSVDGILECTGCEKVYNGVYEGCYYIDGVLANGWVDETYYYVNGIALTGAHVIDGALCVFGDDGVYDADAVYTGFAYDGDDLYYAILSTFKSGWIYEDGDNYYFDSTTYKAVNGAQTIDGHTCMFEDYKLVRGHLVTDSVGTLYWWAGTYVSGEWVEIDGDTYYFGSDHYMYVGIRSVRVNHFIQDGADWYDFGDDGKLVGKLSNYTGILSENGKYFYAVNGSNYYGGLLHLDTDGDGEPDAYYYARSYGQIVTNATYWVTKTNDLLPAGWYEFGEDGKMVVETEEPEEKLNGIVEVDGVKYYYVDGVKTYGGLMLIDGDYYYAKSNGQIVTGKYWVTKTNDLVKAGWYEFGEDGKMVVETEEPEEKLNGIVEVDGVKYYYVDGVKTYGGLMLIDGDYYYAKSNGQIVTGKYWVTKTNDLLKAGWYEFGEDGKMIVETEEPEEKLNGIVEENGKLYWYVDGVKTYGGLMLIDGDYYYAKSNGQIVTGKYWVTKTNDLLKAGWYEFGEDGKMIVETEEPEKLNGIVEENGKLYYYVDGEKTYGGLMLIDGDYYYAKSNGQIVTGKYWVTKTNDLVKAGWYEFGEDGKMEK